MLHRGSRRFSVILEFLGYIGLYGDIYVYAGVLGYIGLHRGSGVLWYFGKPNRKEMEHELDITV